MKPFLINGVGPILVILWSLLIEPSCVQASSFIWAQPPLAGLIEEAMGQNKEIQSLEESVESLKELIPYAGSLQDPRIGIGALNVPVDTFSFNQEPMTQKQIAVSQKFPWFGKLGLRSQRQASIANNQYWLLEARRFELARQIAVAYYELGYVGRGLEINDRLIQLVVQLRKVAESRYSTGQGLQQDVLQAHVELTKLLNEKVLLEREYRNLEDRINELLNRDRFNSVTPPDRLIYPALELDVAALQDQSLKQNPRLAARQTEINQAEVEVRLAEKDYWPDMDVTLAYGQRGEDLTGRDLPDFVSGSVVVNVPLWYKTRQNKQLAAMRKRFAAARNRYRNLVEALPYQVSKVATDINKFQENYLLFTDALLPQAQQWAKSSLAAYQVREVEFDTMIRAQLQMLQLELQSDRYLFNIYQKRAELEELLGGQIF
ncbi:MAG: TolC family protein [Desulfobacterales bacterium]